MKQFLKQTLLWIALAGSARAGVPAVYNNYGVLTTPVNITAIRFNNFGLIDFSLLTAFTNRNGAGFASPLSGNLYNTYSTSFFTNTSSGVMTGEPGFRFANVTPRTILPAAAFVNKGTITALDTPVGISVYNATAQGGIIIPNQNQTIPSQIVVNATKAVNSGTISVGTSGTMNLTARDMDLSYGTITAGNVSATNLSSIEDTLTAESYTRVGNPGKLYTQDAANTFDLLWGLTNGLTGRLDNIVFPEGNGLYTVFLPIPPGTTNRNGETVFGTLLGTGLSAFAYSYINSGPLDVYDNIVFVKTNFADPRMSVKVGFGAQLQGFNYVPLLPNQGDPLGIPDLVTYTETTTDPITGNALNYSLYLEDDGATLNPFELAQNAQYFAAYSRPDMFEVTRTEPFIGADNFVDGNTTFDPTMIYDPTPGLMGRTTPMTNAIYQAQIGRNPETLDGVFTDLTGLAPSIIDIPEITNAPGRITINANNLNLHNLKLSAEGLLTINATNVTGLPTVFNYGTADINLGAKTNSLIVSNLVPILFEQLRGNLEAWSGDWVSYLTNGVAPNQVISTNHVHVLFVDQNLSAQYTPTIRNFFVKSTNIVITDNVRVIHQAIFNGRDLTVSAAVRLTADAADLFPAGTPNLRNLLITPSGSLTVDSLLDIGFNTKFPVSASSPVGRTYSVLTITNQGLIIATAPTLQARTIEQDGTIDAINGGSVVLAASTLNLGLAGNSANTINAGGTVTMSGTFVAVSNSTIVANQIEVTPVRQFTDFVPGTLGTNVVNGASVLVNSWTVTNELALTRKATTGDLYGTEIRIIAKDGPPTTVSWAGIDGGDSLSGFVDNGVIGHLILDRKTSASVIQFNATGKRNAIYVNYLELADFSFSDYQNNLLIDPRMKIYFASANVPYDKLTNLFPQMVFAADALAESAASPSLLMRRTSAQALAGAAGSAATATPFTPVAGVYSGLFAPLKGVSSANSGFFTFTLNKNGALSGRILTGNGAIPFSAKLDAGGGATFGVKSMAVYLATDSGGNVVGAVNGGAWEAVLSGALTPTWAAASPSPNAGQYAMVLPGVGGSDSSADSFGTVTVTAQGALTAVGQLSDGAKFSQATRVTKDGQWPFFAYAPGGHDILLGWLNFAEDHAGLSGNVTWVKSAGNQTGFAVSVDAVGTAYVAPAKVSGAPAK